MVPVWPIWDGVKLSLLIARREEEPELNKRNFIAFPAILLVRVHNIGSIMASEVQLDSPSALCSVFSYTGTIF